METTRFVYRIRLESRRIIEKDLEIEVKGKSYNQNCGDQMFEVPVITLSKEKNFKKTEQKKTVFQKVLYLLFI